MAAVCEYWRSPEALEQAEIDAAQVLETRYPTLPQHVYYRGVDALEKGDYKEARRLFEEALEARLHTEESLLYNYTLLLMGDEEPQEKIDQAAELWRKHFPHSKSLDPRRQHVPPHSTSPKKGETEAEPAPKIQP